MARGAPQSNSVTPTSLPVCRCCGSSAVEYLGSKRGEIRETYFHYYYCRRCSFRFISPFLGPEIYDDAYYRGEGPDPFVDYEREHTNYAATDRMLEFNDLFDRAADYLSRTARSGADISWLDLGCGAGGFLKFLRDRDRIVVGEATAKLHLYGCDVGVWADRLRERDGFSIFSVEQLKRLPAEQFDVISLIEVLEHIPFPQEAIDLASRLLKKGGLLLLTTGNMDSAAAKRKGLYYRYFMSEIHISLFNPSCLRAVYKRAELEPVYFTYKGVIAFKIVKALRGSFMKWCGRLLVRVPFVVKFVDRRYGISAMPCARKPIQ